MRMRMRRTRRNIADQPLQELPYGERSKKKTKKEIKQPLIVEVEETECLVQQQLPHLEKKEASHYESQYQTENGHIESKQEQKPSQTNLPIQQTQQHHSQSSKGKRAKKYPMINTKEKAARVPRKARKQSIQTKVEASEAEAPKKRSRRIEHIPPKTTSISLTEIKNLGFNIRKLSSKQLQEMCMTFCPLNNQRIVGKSTIFSFDLQKLDRQTFRNMQCFVRNKCQQRNLQYESMPADSDDDFMIEDDI